MSSALLTGSATSPSPDPNPDPSLCAGITLQVTLLLSKAQWHGDGWGEAYCQALVLAQWPNGLGSRHLGSSGGSCAEGIAVGILLSLSPQLRAKNNTAI